MPPTKKPQAAQIHQQKKGSKEGNDDRQQIDEIAPKEHGLVIGQSEARDVVNDEGNPNHGENREDVLVNPR